ncbi:MAG: hypothetical protein PHH54_06435 [Candidatus Nanoarchaeia archaeon]|nr:hypothetical protein [Candidatus Nanoarchaeia archaeon]MDD5741593.1 hypothetical protein [Candidatus Nanoarchaeia archaeon]
MAKEYHRGEEFREKPNWYFSGEYEIVSFKRNSEGKIENVPGNLYAILLNAYPREHSQNITINYLGLLNQGVNKNNIFVLEGEGIGLCVDLPATRAGLETAISSIKDKIKSNDRLYFHVTNHGGINEKGLSEVNLYNDKIDEADFSRLVRDINCNFGVFYFSQCHSGGFAETIARENEDFIGISNARKSRLSRRREVTVFTPPLINKLFETGTTVWDAFLDAADKTDPEDSPQLYFRNANPMKLSLFPKKEDLKGNWEGER